MTIGDVTKHDTDYWCIVEKSGTDDGAYFHLSVTDGKSPEFILQNPKKNILKQGSGSLGA